jgi:DNA-binding MarR family transcriptional regulator
MVSAPLPARNEKLNGKAKLRLWLRLLRASRIIENTVRERFKNEFDVTLPRFDVMAALYRRPEGMLMSEISRFLMVSNGNVTGIVDRLVLDKLAERSLRDGDRRTSFIKLTRKGKTLFEQMATAHRGWIDEMLKDVPLKDANDMSLKLKSFRSNWEGEA